MAKHQKHSYLDQSYQRSRSDTHCKVCQTKAFRLKQHLSPINISI